MGGCQNYDPFLGTLNIKCRIIIGIQKGTIILTTTQMKKGVPCLCARGTSAGVLDFLVNLQMLGMADEI